MRRLFLPGCLVLLVAVLAGSAFAQTSYDLANHLLLQTGQWLIEESRPLGQSAPVQRVGIVVTKQGPYTMQNEFDWNGKAWVPSSVQVYEVTSTHVIYHGEYEPISGRYSVLATPMRVPRHLKVHEPFTYKGAVITGSGTMPATIHIEITGDKITKVVKAGTFTGCIRMKVMIVTNDTTEISSEILAPGHGRVASVEADLDETEPEPQMLSGDVYERTDPKKP